MLPAFGFLNVFCICALGFITSFTDLKKGLIRNKFVFPAIAIAFILNFANGYSFPAFLINGFLAFLLGFLLWLASLWSAGDSKLFLAFALLFPLGIFPTGSFFPAFTILVNSFLPAFAFMLFLVLSRTSKKQKLEAFKAAFKPGLMASVAVFLFVFYWLLYIVTVFLRIRLDFFTSAILIFLLVASVEMLLPKKSAYFFGGIALILLAYFHAQVFSLEFAAFFLSFLLLFLLLLFFVLKLGIACFGKPVKVKDLRQGMVLLEIVFEKNQVLEKKEPLLPSFVNIFLEIRERPFLKSASSGLTQDDLELLKSKKLAKKARFETLMVQETLPFAPLIFIGTILSFFTPLFFTL